MSWETFWAPHLLQATLFAGLAAIVSGIIGTTAGLIARWWWKKHGIPWVRTWAGNLISEKLLSTTNAALAAADHAAEAVVASTTSGEVAQTAADNSRQANEAIVWLAEQVAHRDAVNEDLRERIDRLLGTRARLLAAGQVPDTIPVDDAAPSGLLIPAAAGDADEPMTITGRHRLHTQVVATVDEDATG